MGDFMDEETMLVSKSQASYLKIDEALALAEHEDETYTTVRTKDLRNIVAHYKWLAETRLLELMYQSYAHGEDDDD